MTEHNLPDKDDAPWLNCMDGFKTEEKVTRTTQESRAKSATTLNQSLMTDPSPITPPPELVRKWQREANHNEPMFPQVAAMAAQWGYHQHEKELVDSMNSLEYKPTKSTMTDLSAVYRKIAEGTFLAQDRDSNFPGENSM